MKLPGASAFNFRTLDQMPICRTFSNPTLCYTIWIIEESEVQLRKLATLSEEEILEFSNISNKNRRLQWLTARIAIKATLENRGGIYYGIKKDNNGKPHLVNSSASISISHCAEYAIAALCSTHNVGIDIQKCTDTLCLTKTKFLSPVELVYRDLATHKLCILWSAKEAIYKLFSGRIFSIKNEILIEDFTVHDSGVLYISCMRRKINAYYELYNDYIICYAIA